MTDLLVDRMHVTAVADDGLDAARARSLARALSTRWLEDAARAVDAPGLWCLRRVDVDLVLERGASDAAVGRLWAERVSAALATGLARAGDEDVVHYARPAVARVDAVAGLATGRTGRAWAWRAAGVLVPRGPDPTADPAGAALSVLDAAPELVPAVLAGAVHTAGLAALHRLLRSSGWRHLGRQVLAVHAAAALLDDEVALGRPGPPVPPPGAPVALDPQDLPDATADAVLQRSVLARAVREGRLAAPAGVVTAWAVLALAESEPAALRRADLPRLVAGVAARIAPPSPGTAAPGPPVPPPAPAGRDLPPAADPRPREYAILPSEAASAAPDPPGTRAGLPEDTATDVPDLSRAPDVPDGSPAGPDDAVPEGRPPDLDAPAAPTTGTDDGPEQLRPTVWAGLVHLLATADEAGVPDLLLDDPRLGERAASWVLFHVLLDLTGRAPDAAEDPTVRVLAGLPPAGRPPAGDPTPDEAAALAEHAERWARCTAERLRTDLPPRAAVLGVLTRVGTVLAVPGWSEIRMRLVDVDLEVRRAGLDLDPGFVPWLGSVVVIRYA